MSVLSSDDIKVKLLLISHDTLNLMQYIANVQFSDISKNEMFII